MTTSSRRERDILRPVLSVLPSPVAALLEASPRASNVARDLTSFVQGFLGPMRPVSQRYVAPVVEGPQAIPGERALRVLEVRRETRDAVSLVLERPAGETYLAGQFLTLVLPIGERGQELRRSYSLSSTPLGDEPFVVTVKRIPGGVVSSWLHDDVQAGATLRVRGPSGNFTYQPGDAPAHLLLVGGGSGITPLFGILRTALAGNPTVRVTLVFANRAAPDVIFLRALTELAASEPRLTVHHVLESDDGTLPCTPGRVTAATLERALAEHDRKTTRAYVCGPDPMMDGVLADLASLGVTDVHRERFVTVRPAVVREGAGGRHHLRVGGRTVPIPAGKTVLEGAVQGGVDLDFSCTMGGCGACKARLASGEVALDEPNCLTDEERAAGMILTCVAHPLTDVTIERIH